MSDHHAPAHGLPRTVGIGVAEGVAVGVQRERERIRVVGGFGGVDQTVRGSHRLVIGTGDRQCDDQGCPGECMGVATACELGAAPLDPPFGLADVQVCTAEPALDAEGHLVAVIADNRLTGVAVADSRLDPSDHPALRRHHIQERKPGMIDGAGGLDEFFGPGYRLIILDQKAEERRVGGDGGGDVEVAVVGGPPERGAQVGQLGGEPRVGLALSGAVPQRHDVGFAPGEVASMGGPDLGGLAARDELLLGELADRLQHRKPGPPR